MFWSTVTVIVAELIIIAFLIPLFAAIIWGGEILRYASEERHERHEKAKPAVRSPLSLKMPGAFCPWQPQSHSHAH